MDPTVPEARLPARIGRYTDLHLLGRGGMGAVYRAYDPELDRPVAIKVMLHSTPDFVARFRREAQSIARLTHGNVVQVFDFGVDDDGNPYFVMELVEGTPLDQLLRERGALPVEQTIAIARQAAQGLLAAHRAGIIHRDVKPSNLIIDARGTVKLVDFGIARGTTGAQLTTAASLMGTPGYMAPEQAQGKTVDARADVYALGLTIFELLAGRPPFQADDPIALVVMSMQEPFPDLRPLRPGLPESLVRLVEQMAVKAPEDRVQSCEAVVRALDGLSAPSSAAGAASQGSEPSVPPTNVQQRPVDPTARDARRRGIAIAVGAALAVSGVGVAGVMLFGGHPGASDKPVDVQVTTKPAAKPAARPEARIDPTPANPTVRDEPQVAAAAHTEMARRPAEGTGPLRVAVLKFQNIGKDPEVDALALGIGETAVNEMVGVGGGRLALIERADIESDIGEIDRGKDEHFDRATVAAAGKLEGVHVAVQGGFQRAGNTVRVTSRFVRVQTGEILDTVRLDGKVKQVLALQDDMAKLLRGRLLAIVDKERPTGEKGAP